jgi:hypothetical protein
MIVPIASHHSAASKELPLRAVPFDIEAADAMADWRERLAWPVPASEFGATVVAATRALITFLGTLPEGETRDAGVLAAPLVLSRAGALIATAQCLEAEPQNGLRLESSLAELAFLRGETTEPAIAPLMEGAPMRRVRAPFVRRLARMWTWTGPFRLLPAWFAPKALAIGHNDLLSKVARADHAYLGYDHAHLLFARARANGKVRNIGFDVGAVARSMTQALSSVPAISEDLRARLGSLIEMLAVARLQRAAQDLAALRGWRDAPGTLWSANGGYYPARALALEILRRGGEVVGFAHGGAPGLVDSVEPLALGNLAVASQFVVPTPTVAENIRRLGGPALVGAWRNVQIAEANGSPQFAGLGGERPARTRKVLYVSTALCGFRTVIPPALPDPVYLDWVLRLANRLALAPIDLLCQPHPEGLFHGRRHPLAHAAAVSGTTFERAMKDRDLFVFDWPQSTTFWKALCTDKPIVFIDLGLSGFAPGVDALIARRCRIVRARYDERNLPQVDWKELEDALLGGPEAADGAPFRRLLAGED